MCKPIVELKHGNQHWVIYEDGSQTGFPTGTAIRVYPPFRKPEIAQAAQRANELFAERGRAL